MFEELSNRYVFKGVVQLETPLHIGGAGSSASDAPTDAPFVWRWENGVQRPYIPGSSLRGALRSTIERIIYTLDPKASCLLFDKGSSDSCISVNEDTKKNFGKLKEDGADEAECLKFLFGPPGRHVCQVCRTFGCAYCASKVRVTDLPLDNNAQINHVMTVRDGVGIDRDTETAADGAKFDYEVVEKGQTFKFEIIAENMGDQDFGVLGLGLLELANGNLWIGGNAAGGLGKCKLEHLKIEYFDQSGTHGLKEYLTQGYKLRSLLEEDHKQPIDFLKGKVEAYVEKLGGDHAKANVE